MPGDIYNELVPTGMVEWRVLKEEHLHLQLLVFSLKDLLGIAKVLLAIAQVLLQFDIFSLKLRKISLSLDQVFFSQVKVLHVQALPFIFMITNTILIAVSMLNMFQTAAACQPRQRYTSSLSVCHFSDKENYLSTVKS